VHKPRLRAKHRSTRKPPLTRDVRSFNRDTAWLATGVLGALFLAALILAVEEHKSKAMQAGRDFWVNVNPATMASVIAESSNSNGKTDTSLYEVPSRQTESAASTPIPAPASTPQENRDAPRQGSTQAPAPKTRNVRNRSSVASRIIDVKRRLIELWHQSLVRSETRSWTGCGTMPSKVCVHRYADSEKAP
jgi:hypothetical protein